MESTPQQDNGTPAEPGTPYIAPALGIDAFRDAAAAIRCLAAGDSEGVHAILSGTDAPRHVAFALATLAVAICRRGDLDDAGINALLAEISSGIFDFILDQPRPEPPRRG